jgi:Predicted ATPase with chaperone activity
MKIQSLVRDNNVLVPVEVELSFLPGLPQIQFLGLPDQVIKESIHRIKSAIRSQGFEFPKAQSILVNIRPNHFKKSSRGLELAVAAGILWEMEQLPRPSDSSYSLIYGELGLKGEVYEPEDLLADYEVGDEFTVLTGRPWDSQKACFHRAQIQELRELSQPSLVAAEAREYRIERPSHGLDLYFPERQAEILKLMALGEHPAMLAGPSGSGKSTMAKSLPSFLARPTQNDMHEIMKLNRTVGKAPPSWRPVVQPHHSTSPLGLIGGGVPLVMGEIGRAHKGVLILDELLEFHPRGQEALREPMEEFVIRLRRGRFFDEYPAETLVVATTNLCPCGDWVPKAKVFCARSAKKCQSYTERLSGPLVDRFHLLFFTQKKEAGSVVLGAEILRSLEGAREFRERLALKDPRFLKLASRWSLDELYEGFPEFYRDKLFPTEMSSRRRELATLRVARTLADLDHSESLNPEHVERALGYTFQSFEALKRLGDR